MICKKILGIFPPFHKWETQQARQKYNINFTGTGLDLQWTEILKPGIRKCIRCEMVQAKYRLYHKWKIYSYGKCR